MNFRLLDDGRGRHERRARGSKSKVRRQRGNMIAFIGAVTLGLVLAILFFALKYTRMLGTNQEQRTAIEGAALQVANDISRIVVDDPNFGLIALSDNGATGFDTNATDGQPTPVRGINTILATVRLDMIIADALKNTAMQQVAQQDYTNAVAAVGNLQAALSDACSQNPSSDHRDWDGNVVNIYQDAQTAYNSNIIRMSGTQSALDPSSLKITLGVLSNGASTNTAIPQPSNYSNVTSDQTKVDTFPNGQVVTCYKSYVDIPYNQHDFVFCGLDNSLKLVDQKQFTTNISNLPAAVTVSSIVKVEADQVYQADANGPSLSQGANGATRVHSAACAQACSVLDPRPFPGQLNIGFPTGSLPEVGSPGDILMSPTISPVPIGMRSPNPGDTTYATPPLLGLPIPALIIPPLTPYIATPSLGLAGGVGIIHWIRRAGTRPNVQSVVNAMASPFNTTPTGLVYQYTFDANGNVVITPQAEAPNALIAESNQQLVGKAFKTIVSKNGNTYGVVFSDLVAHEGRTNGGSHAGEPLLPKAANSTTIVSVSGPANPLGALWAAVYTLLTTLLNLLFPPNPVTTHSVVPPTATTTRTARDTYSNAGGIAVDIEFVKIPVPTGGIY
ncbi:MAG TPA: hypothetical protein V6C86_00050 [Oculatellaceae cyanobacterium]